MNSTEDTRYCYESQYTYPSATTLYDVFSNSFLHSKLYYGIHTRRLQVTPQPAIFIRIELHALLYHYCLICPLVQNYQTLFVYDT